MIDNELLDRYHIDKTADEIGIFQTFLIATDYVIIKAYENALLGKTIEDYADIIEARQYARDEINRIQRGE